MTKSGRAGERGEGEGKFELHSIFHFGKKKRSQFRSKRLTIVHGFRPESGNFDFGKKMMPCKRLSQGEQNGKISAFIAPSTVE